MRSKRHHPAVFWRRKRPVQDEMDQRYFSELQRLYLQPGLSFPTCFSIANPAPRNWQPMKRTRGPVAAAESASPLSGILKGARARDGRTTATTRSEEHTSELQSLAYLVCRLLLETKTQQ